MTTLHRSDCHMHMQSCLRLCTSAVQCNISCWQKSILKHTVHGLVQLAQYQPFFCSWQSPADDTTIQKLYGSCTPADTQVQVCRMEDSNAGLTCKDNVKHA